MEARELCMICLSAFLIIASLAIMIRTELMLRHGLEKITREQFNLRRALNRQKANNVLYTNLMNPNAKATLSSTITMDEVGAVDRSAVPVINPHLQDTHIEGVIEDDKEAQEETMDTIVGDSAIKSDAANARDESYDFHVDGSDIAINSP